MKLFVVALACLLGCALAVPVKQPVEASAVKTPNFATFAVVNRTSPEPEFCKACIEVAVEMINYLLNYILNVGVVGGCTDLCHKALHQKAEVIVCEAACEAIGIDEFIKWLTHGAGPDPIWYCELAKMCTVHDCVGDCLDIDSLDALPKKAPIGTQIGVTGQFTVKNETGTGMTRMTLFFPESAKQMPSQQDVLDTGFKPGTYGVNIGIDTTQFGDFTGDYTLELEFCEGMCGGVHHSRMFSAKNVTFTVTPKQ